MIFKKRVTGSLVGFCSALAVLACGHAQETNWTNTFFGYWPDNGNWSDGAPTLSIDAKVAGLDSLVFVESDGQAKSLSISNEASVLVIGGTLTVAESVSMATNATLSVGGSQTVVEVGGALTGNGLLVVEDGARMTTGSVAWQGATSVAAIVVKGSGTKLESTGTFLLEAPEGEIIMNLSDNATLTVAGGTGTLELKSEVPGGVTLEIGNGSLGAGRGGTIEAAAIVGTGSEKATIALSPGGSTAYVLAPDIRGNVEVLVNGGKSVLTGANDFTGGTQIRRGTLQIGNGGTTGSITGDIENYDKLFFDRSDASSYSSKITESGSVTKNGAGTLTVSGASTYRGNTSVNVGTWQAGATNSYSQNSAYTVASGATLDLNGYNQSIKSLAGAGNVKLGTGTLTTVGSSSTTFSGAISGSGGLTKQGTSTLTLSGGNTYEGLTIVDRGTLRAGSVNAFSQGSVHSVSSGATLGLNNFNQTIGGLAGYGSVTLGSATLTVGGTATTGFSGTISGTGQLAKKDAGLFTLIAANTYSGGTTINGGTLQTTNASALGTGAVQLNSGGALKPVGTLDISSLVWNGGTVASTVGASLLDIAGDLTLSGVGQFDFSSSSGFTRDTEYAILSAGNLGLYDGSDFAGLVNSVFRIDSLTNTLYVSFTGTSTGSILQNDGPYFTLETANFLVSGSVITGGPNDNNTVAGLTFAPGSSLQVFNQLTLTNGDLEVAGGAATLFGSGEVLAPNGLTKLGAGLLNVLNSVVVNGVANISAGTLAVNGTLTAQDVLVQLGAWLKGSGLINGNVINSGTVAPGNSPGTLTVNGDFTQTASGTLQIEVGDSAVDQLIVTGQASLAGTLEAIAFGGHEFAYGDQVPFIQAGSISGTFDQIVVPNNFRGRFLVNGGTGTLLLAPESYTLVAQNQNQRNVAAALDGFIGASGDRDAVSLALDLQTGDQYGNAFDQIAPGLYQTLTDTVIEQTNAQNQMLAQRLSSVRLGARGFHVIGLDQAALTVDRDGKSVADAKGGNDIITQGSATKWSVFVMGNGIFSRVTNVAQVPNYRFNSGGFIVGIDYTFGGDKVSTAGAGQKAVVTTIRQGSSLTVGLYTGYQGTYAKYANDGRMTINSALFGGYATYANGGFYSDLIVGGAYNGYRVSRPIDFSTIDRTARSSPNGGSFTTYLDLGYDWKVGNFTFGPVLSGQYVYAGTAPFTESGADSLNLRLEQQNVGSLRTNVGGRIAYTWQVTDSITIVPEGRMFWQHEYLQGPNTLGASLDGGSGLGFDYETSAPGRDSVITGAGVSANFGDRWNTSFYYNADFGRQDYVSHMISANLGWKF